MASTRPPPGGSCVPAPVASRIDGERVFAAKVSHTTSPRGRDGHGGKRLPRPIEAPAGGVIDQR